MALTEAEKRKIEEEEKYRAQVKEELNDKTSQKRGISTGKGCLIIILIFLAVPVLVNLLTTPNTKTSQTTSDTNTNSSAPKTEPKVDLQGNVYFSGSQFEITNSESRDWNSCRFTLNSDYNYPPTKGLLGAETAVIEKIEANGVYTIGAAQFTLKDGTRFNPFGTKPLTFSVSCENGFGYWSWN